MNGTFDLQVIQISLATTAGDADAVLLRVSTSIANSQCY